MWKPLLRRSGDEWVGVTDKPGIWVGSSQSARARVDLENPVFLWPLLERSREQVLGELLGVWTDLSGNGVRSPEEFAEVIVTSAVRGTQPYWMDLAIGWMQGMDKEPGYRIEHLRALLSEVVESRALGQETRHKALRVLKGFSRGPGAVPG
jgi:hypothetical protein